MATAYLRRGATLIPGQSGKADASPIYVDSDTSTVKVVPGSTGTTEKELVDTSTAQSLTNKTLGAGTVLPTSQAITTPTITGGSLTGAALSANINGDVKVLAATQNFDNQVGQGTTLTTVTGMSWTVVPGTYRFKFHGTVTMTTNGGLKMAFKLTTAVLTSLALRIRQSTDTDNTGAISAAFTTATDQATWFSQKTVAFTNVIVEGTMVVGTGGTIDVQAAQETAHNDDSTIVLGAFAEMERVA